MKTILFTTLANIAALSFSTPPQGSCPNNNPSDHYKEAPTKTFSPFGFSSQGVRLGALPKSLTSNEVVDFLEQNQELKDVLKCFKQDSERFDNYENIKNIIFRTYELKGHPINAARRAWTHDDETKRKQKLDSIFKTSFMSGSKKSRNAKVGCKYDKSKIDASNDFLKLWFLVNSIVEIEQKKASEIQTLYRFGRLNGAIIHQKQVRAQHLVSASKKHALCLPSYIKMSIPMKGTLVLHKIKGTGADIGMVADYKQINPNMDPAIATNEVVFAEGTMFSGFRQKEFDLGNKCSIRKYKSSRDGNAYNVLVKFQLFENGSTTKVNLPCLIKYPKQSETNLRGLKQSLPFNRNRLPHDPFDGINKVIIVNSHT